jgi:heptosyltransferase-1
MTDVLVVRPSSLGDIVYALAIVPDIRDRHPDAAIDWVAEPGFVPLIELCPDVRRVIPFGLRRWRRAPFAATTWRDVHSFRTALRTTRYRVILDLQEQLKGAIIARSALGESHGFDRASIREPLATLGDSVHHRVPRSLHFLTRCRLLAAAALDYRVETPPRWNLQVRRRANDQRRYVVALHATSRTDKLWPEDRWRAVVSACAHAGFDVVVPWGSADEQSRSRRLADSIDGATVPDWLSLPDVAALLAGASLAIGVDTGFTHLAAALGTPTIAIFNATERARHGVACTGDHARDVGDAGMQPTADDVLDAVRERLHMRG